MAETEAAENVDKLPLLLQKCSVDKLAGFIHTVIDSLTDQRPPEQEEFKDVWSLDEWTEVVNSMQSLVRDSIKESKKEDVREAVERFSKAQQPIFNDCIESRQTDLLAILLNESCMLDSSYLRDFDWKLKLVLASDKMSTIRKPLLELDLALQEGSEKKIVSLEMSKEELKKLITSLEAAHKTVLQLTT